MQHFHVHLDLPYHSNESPTVCCDASDDASLRRRERLTTWETTNNGVTMDAMDSNVLHGSLPY